METSRLCFAGLAIYIAMIATLVTSSQDFPQPQRSAVAALATRRLHRNIDAGQCNGLRCGHYEDMVSVASRSLSTSTSRRASNGADADVQALLAFRKAVTNDPRGALSSWNSNDSTACHWKGVTCSQRSQSVISLELRSLAFEGAVSPLLGSLRDLQKLDLSDNFFSGEIPTSLLNCTRLSFLALRKNNLTGHVPFHLGDLQHLRHLDLGMNFLLAGPIPASLGNCSALRLIHLDYALITGEIPPSLGQRASLESLNLTNTLNSGSVPKSLGNCSSLIYLAMGNLYDQDAVNIIHPPGAFVSAKLTGTLPEELGKLERLEGLVIGGTTIQGAFPAWIANLTKLAGLGLEASLFRGEIPMFLGNLPLEILGLLQNNFSGAIPASISNCSRLWYLDMGRNPLLGGNIPLELGLLTHLAVIYLDSNSLTGKIPSSLSNCSALVSITIGVNPLLDPQPLPSWITSLVNLRLVSLRDMNLQGEIPLNFGQLYKLNFLYLWGNQLTGVIPASLGNCTALSLVVLQDNRLLGEVPSEIWKLRQLQVLNIGVNLLTGILPASIGNLSELVYFGCAVNSFSGRIPSQLGSLQSLQIAYLEDNNFNGLIPHSLGNLSALRELHMSQNQLGGSIPTSLGNLTALGYFNLSKNRLSGVIPVVLMRCMGLVYLDLSDNLLVGNIPLEIGQLVFLEGLYLHHNKLTGTLPHSVGFLIGLIYLDLSYNALDGIVPGEEIANMSARLHSVNLSHNFLSGSIPQELAKLTSVYYLDFSVNNFSGSIPSGLGECISLQRLDLSRNNLSGGIPSALGQLGQLVFINMSFNHLEGPFPDGGIFNSTASNLTSASFMGNPGLCGSLVLNSCPAVRASSCKGFRCAHTRIAVACIGAVVGLIAFGVVVCVYCLLRGSDTDEEFHGASSMMPFDTSLKLSEPELLAIIALPENVIGVGTRSTIYKGVLEGGRSIAIKVLTFLSDAVDDDYDYKQAEADLYREAHTLGKLRHRNILKVLGLFSNQKITALILEFMPRASLHQQLYDVNIEEDELTWETRFNIAWGVAQGLLYLHTHAHEPVIHRDLKPSNILLDADLNPKLCDFGISKFVNLHHRDGETTASKIHGTIGYFPPEYAATARVSTKGDVYSYGVTLLELLTRKQPMMMDSESTNTGLGQHKPTTHLVDWVLESCHDNPAAVLDPMLLDQISSTRTTSVENRDDNQWEQIKLLLQVGLLCTQSDPQIRPQMSDVLAMLTQIAERGQDPSTPPSLAELANHVAVSQAQDPNTATLTDSVSF